MTDNIKFPPLPVSANFYGMYGEYTKSQVEALMREAVRLNAQADAKPIYQYQLANGGWIDQTRDSYEYNKANGVKGLRIVYEAAPAAPQQAQPLDLSVMELAESVGLIGPASRTDDLHEAIQRFHDQIVTNASIKAALHFADGLAKPAQQPLLAEKDALLRQALEALEGFVNITNDSQGVKGYHLNGDIAEWDEFDEVDAASNTIEAIRAHLGVKND